MTERTGHMGYTFRFCSAGGVDAVESQFGQIVLKYPTERKQLPRPVRTRECWPPSWIAGIFRQEDGAFRVDLDGPAFPYPRLAAEGFLGRWLASMTTPLCPLNSRFAKRDPTSNTTNAGARQVVPPAE